MLESVLKHPLLTAIAALSLSGCVGPLDLMYDAMVEAQMSPEAVGATPDRYRTYSCLQLKDIVHTFEQRMAADADKRSWRWHINAANQVRAEKNCSATPEAPVSDTAMIGVRMEPVTPSLATALGLNPARGALVVEVLKNLPAEKAGLKTMDIILAVSGQNINSPRDVTDIIGRLRTGTKAEIEVWRERGRKTLMVEASSNAQVAGAISPARPAAAAPAANAPVAAPLAYSYCFYTDVPQRKHWTSNVFQVAPMPGADQAGLMAKEFYQFLSARNNVTPNEQAFCQLYDTQAQAELEWNKTRKLYRFQTVQNNEVAWSPVH